LHFDLLRAKSPKKEPKMQFFLIEAYGAYEMDEKKRYLVRYHGSLKNVICYVKTKRVRENAFLVSRNKEVV